MLVSPVIDFSASPLTGIAYIDMRSTISAPPKLRCSIKPSMIRAACNSNYADHTSCTAFRDIAG